MSQKSNKVPDFELEWFRIINLHDFLMLLISYWRVIEEDSFWLKQRKDSQFWGKLKRRKGGVTT